MLAAVLQHTVEYAGCPGTSQTSRYKHYEIATVFSKRVL
jgi:hypothetical protein